MYLHLIGTGLSFRGGRFARPGSGRDRKKFTCTPLSKFLDPPLYSDAVKKRSIAYVTSVTDEAEKYKKQAEELRKALEKKEKEIIALTKRLERGK